MEKLPICANCGRDMNCVKNGAPVIRSIEGQPSTVLYGDIYGCSDCSNRVVVGLSSPIHFNDKEFDGEISRASRNANAVNVAEDTF